MDFSRQGTGAQPVARPAAQQTVASSGDGSTKHRVPKNVIGRWTRIGYATLLFGTTILVVAIAALTAFSGNDESKYVNTAKYQAVFLNDGSTSGQSVYFGHIVKVTSNYLVLQDIYYITTPSSSTTTTSTTSSSSYQLTKLGCQQLHDPYDQMVINQDQVAFWENLNNNGKVVQTIQTFQKDNPNGPNCSETTSGNTSTGTTQATTPTTTTTTTPTTTTTTTK
jgi:hypothetical protein